MKKSGRVGGGGSGCGSNKAAERSAYFARREAAKVLRSVLQGDARRRAVGSIKGLVYSPSVRNKKATFALVCQTLKYLPLLKEILAPTDVLKGKWKRQEEMMYVTAYDILFGQTAVMVGAAEKFLLLRKNALQHALAQLCKRRKVKHAEDLLQANQTPGVSKPRYVRVNTLKLDVQSAITELEKEYVVKQDSLVSNLLVLPPGTDLHNHLLVKSGSIFLQGRASCMAAEALMPKSGWQLRRIDVFLPLDDHALQVLNINIFHGDFLEINPTDPSFYESIFLYPSLSEIFSPQIRAILLDPSCSGSGTSAGRLDYLLPSSITDHDSDPGNSERVKKLAAFQKKALVHALSSTALDYWSIHVQRLVYTMRARSATLVTINGLATSTFLTAKSITVPAVERVVYSTCSIFQTENEDVISSVIPLAFSLGFRLATPFPEWPRRGLPVFEGSEHLIRTDVAEDMEGFFIALFVRGTNTDGPTQFVSCRGAGNASQLPSQKGPKNPKSLVRDHKRPVNQNLIPALRKGIPYPSPKMHLLSLYMQTVRKKLVKRCTVQ
ncbi:hypothetical protein Taro_027893 [Colocasia esculenta]|uniref:Uncharacterized protein n=1 Tax=Colocasia esculenta TaxID=4460 RepID=A0A843VF25_COLES|nr:hypothetical protein [Colocasia esculenta]